MKVKKDEIDVVTLRAKFQLAKIEAAEKMFLHMIRDFAASNGDEIEWDSKKEDYEELKDKLGRYACTHGDAIDTLYWETMKAYNISRQDWQKDLTDCLVSESDGAILN